MRKLFVQFYLLLFVCFLVMAMLVGLVYKVTAERAGRRSMDDLMKSSLYLIRSELREIPRETGIKPLTNSIGISRLNSILSHWVNVSSLLI